MLPAILTLNISRPPVQRARLLLDYLWHREEELLVLTETGRGGGSELIGQVCRAAGYAVESSLHAPDAPRRPGLSATSLGVLVVGRGVSVTRIADLAPPLLPERTLALEVPAASGPVRLIAAYGPASDPLRYASAGQRQRKREWLLGLCTWLSALPPAPTLVVGDLNIVAPGHRDALPYVLPEETTAYEVLTSGLGLVDVYAAAHVGSPDAAEPSWVDHSGAGCRYDYVLATADVAPGVWTACLDQTPRTRGLTDHGALAASLS